MMMALAWEQFLIMNSYLTLEQAANKLQKEHLLSR